MPGDTCHPTVLDFDNNDDGKVVLMSDDWCLPGD
jgi:hypothetical protein